MKSPWIKKYYNDKRDYIVQTVEVELPSYTIDPTPPEYVPHKQYEVVLVRDQDEVTGQISYYWLEEFKNNRISPKFNTQEHAQYWMKQNEK